MFNSRNMRTPVGNRVAKRIVGGLLSTVRRGRSLTRSPSSARSRRRSISRASSMASSGAATATTTMTRVAGSTHRAEVRKVGKRRIKVRGRKKIKVSPKLKASIIQVTNSNKVRGYYQDNRIDILDPGQLNGQNSVEQFPRRVTALAGSLFSWETVLHAASRLWNTKPATAVPAIGDALNYDPTNTVIEVVKQWWTFRMRNNSSRKCTYRIYKCQKRNSALIATAYDAWKGGLTQMVADGQLIMPNPNPTAMHTGPSLSNQFRQAWRCDETKIVLDPGESYEFSVSGPSMTYRGQDFYDQAVYRSVQKQDIQVIVSSNVDMVGTHTGGVVNNPGYAGDLVTEGTQERTYVESTYHVHIAMPEKVGGVITPIALGAPQLFINQNRVRRTVIDDFQPTTFGTLIHRRDEENPVGETV